MNPHGRKPSIGHWRNRIASKERAATDIIKVLPKSRRLDAERYFHDEMSKSSDSRTESHWVLQRLNRSVCLGFSSLSTLSLHKR